MIIECINCSKKFDVDSNLIPSEGRTIQCGSCNHVWFFKKKDEILKKTTNIDIAKDDIDLPKSKKITKKTVIKKSYVSEKKGSEIVKYNPRSNFTLGKFLSYILVVIISFIALIIILDTFKTPLYGIFPELELILFNLYETLKDINLFIKDLF